MAPASFRPSRRRRSLLRSFYPVYCCPPSSLAGNTRGGVRMLPAPDSPRTSGPAIGRSGSFVAFLLLALTATGCVHTAQDDMARGERLYRSGKYSDASINFQRAIQKNPNLTDAYLWWGRSELMSQNFTEAWKIWYSASHRFPGDEGIKVELGNLCLGALITDPAKPPNLFQILDQLASALLAANPASFDGLRFKGYLATLNRQPKQAIPYFTRAAELRPGESTLSSAWQKRSSNPVVIQRGNGCCADSSTRIKPVALLTMRSTIITSRCGSWFQPKKS